MKQMKLDFPTFHGGDPTQWLNLAEHFFSLYQIPDYNKLGIAVVHLRDDAAESWAEFEDETPHTWEAFTTFIIQHFGIYNSVDCQSALAKLTQTGKCYGLQVPILEIGSQVSGI